MRIEPFELAHCDGAKAHPSQAHYQGILDNPMGFWDRWPETYSAIDDDGLIALGAVDPDGWCWVMFTDKITPARFLIIHQFIVRSLANFEQNNVQISAHIDPDNLNAVRWGRVLGFEARRMDTMPDGRTMARMMSHV